MEYLQGPLRGGDPEKEGAYEIRNAQPEDHKYTRPWNVITFQGSEIITPC